MPRIRRDRLPQAEKLRNERWWLKGMQVLRYPEAALAPLGGRQRMSVKEFVEQKQKIWKKQVVADRAEEEHQRNEGLADEPGDFFHDTDPLQLPQKRPPKNSSGASNGRTHL